MPDSENIERIQKSGFYIKCKFVVNNTTVDVNYKTEQGESILHKAIQSGSLEIVKLLVQKGADLNYSCLPKVNGPVYTAVTLRHYEICEYLLAEGSDPNLVGENQSALI